MKEKLLILRSNDCKADKLTRNFMGQSRVIYSATYKAFYFKSIYKDAGIKI